MGAVCELSVCVECVVMESPFLGGQGDGDVRCPVKIHPNYEDVCKAEHLEEI